MKSTILDMGKEGFDFEEYGGKLLFSTELVELNISGKGEGSFFIVEESGAMMKGFVTTSDIRMRCLRHTFSGTKCEIDFVFDEKGLLPGTRIKGKFFIISDKGEYCLPYEVNYEPVSCDSHLGDIKNLFHFANLAKEYPAEAVQFFYSPGFLLLLTGNDKQYRTIYRGLSRYEGNRQNVDEFLIAVKKKARIQYELKEKELFFDAPESSAKKTIEVQRLGWGYTHLKVSTDADFIHLSKEEYDENDFLGDTLGIDFYVDRVELHKGNNHGKITVSDGYTQLTVQVQVHKLNEKPENAMHLSHKLTAELAGRYLEFCSRNLTKPKWIAESQRLIEKLLVIDDKNLEVRLYQIQMLIFSGRKEEAAKLMEKISDRIDEKDCTVWMQAYYLYLTSLIKKDEGYVDKVTSRIRKLYQKNSGDWRLAWLMLFLDRELLEQEESRYLFIKEQYRKGMNSPFLYTEAVAILKKNPSILMSVSGFERQLIRFAVKQQILTEGLLEQTVSVLSREREYSDSLFHLLVACYRIKPMDETLKAICLMLVKAARKDSEAFYWYRLAVERELKITGLYEYYMMSADLSDETLLPRAVLLYFLYENKLDYERTAYLYANLLRNKNLMKDMCKAYSERISMFVAEQIKCGRMNENLAYLYREVLAEEPMEPEVAYAFASLLFLHLIQVKTSSCRKIVVIHEKAVGEKIIPLKEGKAFAPVFSSEYEILLEDEEGNRYLNKEAVKVSSLLFSQALLKEVAPYADQSLGLTLYLCEDGKDAVFIDESNVEGFTRLLHSNRITAQYRKEILVKLVEYDFNRDLVRELSELLDSTSPKNLSSIERAEFIRIMIARGRYDQAFEWVMEYGTQQIDIKYLMRLASRLLERRDFEKDERMVELCAYIFRCHKYDQNILQYLVSNFEGTTAELKDIWLAAVSFDIAVYPLLERLMVQMLFSGVYLREKNMVFETYVKEGADTGIEAAYLSKCSYDYFVRNSVGDERVFSRMLELMRNKERLNRICRLAFLKFYSDKAGIITGNIKLISDYLQEFMEEGMQFKFFQKYVPYVSAVASLGERCFIEYRAKKDSLVTLHYVLERGGAGENEYRKEEMQHMYGGIFTRSFVIFSGDRIQYYITEENSNSEQLTESNCLVCPVNIELSEGRYKDLNEIALSLEMQDDTALKMMLEEYRKKEFLIDRLFGL